MTPEHDLQVIRRAYARQVTFAGGTSGGALEDAYASVRREDFLGPGPWPMFRWGGYATTPTADPVYLYSDVLVGIVPERGLNNGQPSSHATWIASVAPRPGEHLVHVGAGLGYYSAIMAQMVGASGRVTAIEYDLDLAARAKANFADWPNVTVLQGDGATVAFDPADAIYVNAGATRPADAWLDGLKDGGRLLLPLTTSANFRSRGVTAMSQTGAFFLIERRGEDFLAKQISAVGIIPGEGLRDEISEAALATAFEKGGSRDVTRLYRTAEIPEERAWVRAPGWSLAFS